VVGAVEQGRPRGADPRARRWRWRQRAQTHAAGSVCGVGKKDVQELGLNSVLVFAVRQGMRRTAKKRPHLPVSVFVVRLVVWRTAKTDPTCQPPTEARCAQWLAGMGAPQPLPCASGFGARQRRAPPVSHRPRVDAHNSWLALGPPQPWPCASGFGARQRGYNKFYNYAKMFKWM
jgi:hypothetical protein